MKNKNTKSKKKLLVLFGIGTFTILGSTLAYFTTNTTLNNVFNVAKYQTHVTETFKSPDNWMPGTTTSKQVTVSNDGTMDMAVRASYSEKWVNANGKEIPLQDDEGNVASIINFNDDWNKDADGYYYYGSKQNLTKLQPYITSTSFINSVTFNKDIKASLNKTTSDDGTITTYKSTGDSYDGAVYTLTIKIDTIQYDQANNIW